MTTMKKTYQTPSFKMIIVQNVAILAGSVKTNNIQGNGVQLGKAGALDFEDFDNTEE